MNIITLFCKMVDFFLAYEKWQGTHCLPERTPLETRGHPRQLNGCASYGLSPYAVFFAGRMFHFSKAALKDFAFSPKYRYSMLLTGTDTSP